MDDSALQPANSRRVEFLNGIKDTVPMIVGAMPFGIIFGTVAVTGGLTPAATLGMSLFVFAGSAQFIAAGLVAQGAGVALIVLTTFVVNVRHALYSASLAPYVRHLPQRWLLPLGFWLTDETYAVVIRRYVQDKSPYRHWYHFGSALSMYINWQLCTLIGIYAGTELQGIADVGLEFAMVVTFLGIVVPLVVTRAMLACAIAAALTAFLFYPITEHLYLIIAAVVGIAAGVITEQVAPPEKASSETSDVPESTRA